MKVTNNEKETLEKVHLISGVRKDDVRLVFEALFSLVVMNYMEEETTLLPFLGDLVVEKKGDEYENDKKKALLDAYLVPGYNLIRNIGQVADGEETDVEELFRKRLRNTLYEQINS